MPGNITEKIFVVEKIFVKIHDYYNQYNITIKIFLPLGHSQKFIKLLSQTNSHMQ